MLVHQLCQGGSLNHSRISFLTALSEVTVKTLCVPSEKRLAAEMACDDHATANNLALFHGEVDGIAALIANDQIKSGSKRLLKDLCHQVSAVGGARGATPERLTRLQDIIERFVGCISTHKKHHLGLFHRTDPIEFTEIKLDFFRSGKLLHIPVRLKHPQRQAV